MSDSRDTRSWRKFGLTQAAFVLVLAAVFSGLAMFGNEVSPAHFGSTVEAQPAAVPAPESLPIPPGEKLEGVSWACHPGGWCEPWLLTSPLYRGYTATQYRFRNPKTGQVYVVTETHPKD